MEIKYDGCTEYLLDELRALKPDDQVTIKVLTDFLPALREDCLKGNVCPAGELARGYMCRQFLRDAVRRMEDRLGTIDEDQAVKTVMQQSKDFIEHMGDETEAERAYIVVRNLVIISENIAQLPNRPVKIPGIVNDPMKLQISSITQKGIDAFVKIASFVREKDLAKLAQRKGNGKDKYRPLFFNVIMDLIECREM